MPRYFLCSRQLQVVASFIVLAMSIRNGALGAESSAPTIEAKLIRETVLVGEPPRVQITVTAPEDTAIDMLRREYLEHFDDITFRLRNPKGDLIECPNPILEPIRPRTWPGYYHTLKAGGTLTWNFAVASRPQMAGPHQLDVKISPLRNPQWRFKKTLALQSTTIEPKSIVSRKELVIPETPLSDSDLETLVFLNVKVDHGNYLVYIRKPHASSSKPDEVYTSRICSLEGTSTVTAVSKPAEFGVRNQDEIWLTFDISGELVFMRLSESIGFILERRVLNSVCGEKSPTKKKRALQEAEVEPTVQPSFEDGQEYKNRD